MYSISIRIYRKIRLGMAERDNEKNTDYCELLSPAGDFDSLKAAAANGCNAVYVLESFSAQEALRKILTGKKCKKRRTYVI